MKNKKGFTLVELLAVIVILGVLLVTATPMVFNAIKDSKKKTKCKVVKEVVAIYKSYAYLNKTETCVKNNSCTFEYLIGKGYLDSEITSPITREKIGTEKANIFLSSSVFLNSKTLSIAIFSLSIVSINVFSINNPITYLN